MSEFHVICVRLSNVEKHPNANSLSLASAGGYPVIFRTGDYHEGDLVAYVPVDALVDVRRPEFSFLEKDAKADGFARIRAKKLRGIFSMGLIVAPPPGAAEGDNVQTELGIGKYDPDLVNENRKGKVKFGGVLRWASENEKDPGIMPKYDIEGLRRYSNVLVPGEEVWISEKIHGQNARYVFHDGRLWVASRNNFKRRQLSMSWGEFLRRKLLGRLGHISWKTFLANRFAKNEIPSCVWWEVAVRYDLEAKLAKVPGIAIYGESYGNNADMPYGVRRPEGDRFVMFDAYDTAAQRWFDVDEMLDLAERLAIPVVPSLYRGSYDPDMAVRLAEGRTTLGDDIHVREGIVIKPLKERTHPALGRVFLKLAGQGYLLRKESNVPLAA